MIERRLCDPECVGGLEDRGRSRDHREVLGRLPQRREVAVPAVGAERALVPADFR